MIFASLIDLSDKSANAVIRAALNEFNYTEGLTFKWGDYGPFRNKVTQKKILAFGTNPDGTAINKTAGQAAWDRLIGKPADINSLMLEEIIFLSRGSNLWNQHDRTQHVLFT